MTRLAARTLHGRAISIENEMNLETAENSREADQVQPQDGLFTTGDGRELALEAQELLALAQEAGGFGIFEWKVPDGTMRLSPKLLALHGLTRFDGRYDTWIGQVFREDLPSISDTLQAAFSA